MKTSTLKYALLGLVCYKHLKQKLDMGLKRLYESFLNLISPKFYIFFEEYSMPFPAFSLNMDSKLAAKATLVYNADEHIFFPYIPSKSYAEIVIYNSANPLSLLSMEILDENDMPIADLTDFIETLRYIYVQGMEVPTVSNVVAAWCVTNSIPLNRSRYSVRYITSVGDVVNASLIDMTPLDDEPEIVRSTNRVSSDSDE